MDGFYFWVGSVCIRGVADPSILLTADVMVSVAMQIWVLFNSQRCSMKVANENDVPLTPSPRFVGWGCLKDFSQAALRELLQRCRSVFAVPRRRVRRGQLTGLMICTEVPESRCVMSAVSPTVDLVGSVTFDFGTDQSPVDPGSIQVSHTIRYSAGRGYGMTSDVTGTDRGQDDDLQRDFVEGGTVGFRVDVPNGLYQVEPVLGDRRQVRERVQVSINGEVRDTLTTLGGTPVTPSYYVTVTDGSIRLEVTDLGGESQRAALAAVTITACDSSAGIPEDNPADSLNHSPLLVVLTHGRVSPPKRDGGLLGTVVSKLAGDEVKEAVGGEEGAIAGGFVEGVVKSAFPSEGRPDVSEWVYEAARGMAKAIRREGLGNLNPNVRPIPLPKIEQAADDAALLKLHKGSPDFIATNWSIESSYGTPQDSGDVKERPWDIYNEIEHRAAVTRAATAVYRMLAARCRQDLQRNPGKKVDLLIVGHSFGTSVNREVILMLNRSEFAAHVDFVKVVELDPVAMKQDPRADERADSHDRYFWNSPELARNGRPIVDSIVNYYQTEGLAFTGIVENGLVTGQPLDGQDGGGLLGFRNGHAMVFSPQSGDTLDQFRLFNDIKGKPSDGDLRNGVYSDNGRFMAIASEDGTVSLRDAVNHREMRRMVVSKEKVTDVQFLSGSAELLTVSRDGEIRLFRVSDGALVWSGRHQDPSVVKSSVAGDPEGARKYRGAKVAAVSSDGRVLATAGTAERIFLWLRRPGANGGYEVVQSLRGHVGGTTSLSFAPDGTLVTGGKDGQLWIWKRGREVYEQMQSVNLGAAVGKVQFSGDGRYLATAAGSGVSLWMPGASGDWIRTREFRDHIADAEAVAFTKDGRWLATGGADHTIFIYDTSNGAKVNVLNQAMLEVRNLAFSPDGGRLLATYYDMPGGPIRDINVTEQVRSRVGLIENVMSGGSKHHSEVPFVYIDLVILKTNDAFFEMRDKPRASRYGDFEPGDLSRPDDDVVIGPAAGESEIPADADMVYPWIDQISNVHAPEIINSIADMTVTDTLAISLSGLAMDADGNALQWTVRSSDTATILATIEGNSLQLRPLQEGRAEIELTVNDGRWAGQIRFWATADGSVWREKAAVLRKEAESVVSRLRELDSRIDSVGRVLAELNSQWKDVEDRVGRLRSGVADLQKEFAAAAARVDRLTQTRSGLLTARAAAEGAVARAETALQSAVARHAGLDATTRQLYQVFEQRQNERQQARQRLDSANKSNRAARQADFNRASEAAAAAEANWRASQAQRDAALAVVEDCRRQRNNLAAELSRQNRLLSDCEADLTRARKDLADCSTRLSGRLSSRNELLAQMSSMNKRLEDQQVQLQALRGERNVLDEQLGVLRDRLVMFRQTKWVTRIGLDRIEETLLDPAAGQSRQLNERISELLSRITSLREKLDGASNQLRSLG